jgi:hypothetical protein
MRTSLLHALLAATVVGIACTDDITNPVTEWEAVLSGGDVVPATTSAARGDASFTVSGTTLTFTVNITTAPATAITRIDLAQVNAGSTITSNTNLIALCGSGTLPACGATSSTGTVTVTEANITTMRAFGFNVTVRTVGSGTSLNGEIRGQLRNVVD